MARDPNRRREEIASTVWLIWFMWFVSFIWLNQTNRIDRTDQRGAATSSLMDVLYSVVARAATSITLLQNARAAVDLSLGFIYPSHGPKTNSFGLTSSEAAVNKLTQIDRKGRSVKHVKNTYSTHFRCA